MKKLVNLTMFDLLKGVAMLCVLLGHSVYHSENSLGLLWYGKVTHSLLMPALFVISGYWLKKKSAKSGIKAGVMYLVAPLLLVLLVINSIAFLHRVIVGRLDEWLDLFLMPSLLMLNKPSARLGPLWFILSLFWAWCLFSFVVRIKEEKWQIAIAVVSALLGGALMPLKLPFQIAPGLVAFSFVYFGYLLKKKKTLEKRLHPLLLGSMLIVWGVTVVYGSMDLYMYDMKYGIVSAIGSLCGAFLMIKLFLYINLLEWRWLDGIRWIGRYSMWFLLIHAVEKAVFPWKILFRFVPQESMAGMILWFVLRTVMILVICVVVQKFQLWRNKRKQAE